MEQLGRNLFREVIADVEIQQTCVSGGNHPYLWDMAEQEANERNAELIANTKGKVPSYCLWREEDFYQGEESNYEEMDIPIPILRRTSASDPENNPLYQEAARCIQNAWRVYQIPPAPPSPVSQCQKGKTNDFTEVTSCSCWQCVSGQPERCWGPDEQWGRPVPLDFVR